MGSANQSFPSGWLEQSFLFQSPSSRESENGSYGCSFGLIQNKGGPCGLLAVVQAYIMKVCNLLIIGFYTNYQFRIYQVLLL